MHAHRALLQRDQDVLLGHHGQLLDRLLAEVLVGPQKLHLGLGPAAQLDPVHEEGALPGPHKQVVS